MKEIIIDPMTDKNTIETTLREVEEIINSIEHVALKLELSEGVYDSYTKWLKKVISSAISEVRAEEYRNGSKRIEAAIKERDDFWASKEMGVSEDCLKHCEKAKREVLEEIKELIQERVKDLLLLEKIYCSGKQPKVTMQDEVDSIKEIFSSLLSYLASQEKLLK